VLPTCATLFGYCAQLHLHISQLCLQQLDDLPLLVAVCVLSQNLPQSLFIPI
jgi:hypothetical protein